MYLNRGWSVAIVFSVGLKIFNIHIGQPRDDELHLLLIEQRNVRWFQQIIEAGPERVDLRTDGFRQLVLGNQPHILSLIALRHIDLHRNNFKNKNKCKQMLLQ